jgi:hypothetical protein
LAISNSLMEHYHYLSREQPVGERLKYVVWAQRRPIACLAWSSAPRHLGSRDRYIGWSAEARRRNIRPRVDQCESAVSRPDYRKRYGRPAEPYKSSLSSYQYGNGFHWSNPLQ